jgi:hypothetical protein
MTYLRVVPVPPGSSTMSSFSRSSLIMKYIDPGPGFQTPALDRLICSWSSAPDRDDSERS